MLFISLAYSVWGIGNDGVLLLSENEAKKSLQILRIGRLT
jgi:hypothetical protein